MTDKVTTTSTYELASSASTKKLGNYHEDETWRSMGQARYAAIKAVESGTATEDQKRLLAYYDKVMADAMSRRPQ